MTDIVQIQESEYDAILRQAVAVLPWGHTLTLMRKFGEDDNAILCLYWQDYRLMEKRTA